MNPVAKWGKINGPGSGQGEQLLSEQELLERVFDSIQNKTVVCDKTKLSGGSTSLIDDVIAGLNPDFTWSDLF